MIPEDQFKLAIQHHTAGRLAEAAAIYRQILAQQPQHVGARMNLATALRTSADAIQMRGDLPQAVQLYREAIQLNPGMAEAYNNLGSALKSLGQFDQAVEAFQSAARINPQLAEAHRNLGEALLDTGQYQQAIVECQQAIRLRPDYHEAHNNLGIALRSLGRLDEAMAAYKAALQFNPESAEALSNLAEVLELKGENEAAMAACERAVQLNPRLPAAQCTMASLQKNRGEMDAAVASLRTAIALNLDDAVARDSLIFLLHFHEKCDMRAIATENREWSRRFADPLRTTIRPHTNDRNPDRRLRIGYVSPDFRSHAECFFVLPFMEAHDHAQFKVHAYSSVRRPDDVTARFHKCVDVWHDVLGEPDAAMAERIRNDRIDILIDLTMHMMDGRLPVFARKPVPVQVTWLAYPGSSGIQTIDYRLTDSYLEPPDADASWSVEKPIRLPDYWCIFEPVGGAPEVNKLPALKAGHITFASLNNFCKFNSSVLKVWAEILKGVPNSRLMMLCAPGDHRAARLEQFRSDGVDPSRIEFVSPLPRDKYLELYHRIDIGLDPFPCGGVTTTCDALWMGVPVLTFPGAVPPSRCGLGLLTAAGLPEFIAKDQKDYVRLAIHLANDRPALISWRSRLRPHLQSSKMMDAPRFARNVEAAYRQMWRTWCGVTNHPS